MGGAYDRYALQIWAYANILQKWCRRRNFPDGVLVWERKMLLFLEEVILRLRFVPRPKLTGAAAQARRRGQNRQRQAKRRALKRGKGKAMDTVEVSPAVEGEEVEEVEIFEEFSDGEELVETASRPLNSNSGIESSFCSLLTRLAASRRPFIPAPGAR